MTRIARRLPALAWAATLTASLNACGGGDGTGQPTVPAAPIAVVAISGGASSLTPGQSTQFVATASTAAGQVVSGAQFSWISEKPDVATVDGVGKVTALSVGSATITATASGVHATTMITVQPPPDPLTAIVDSIRSVWNMPAMGVAIVTLEGGLTAVAAAGKRRVTGGSPVTTNDLWHLGSNIKAMTALLAAVAVTQGRIQWTTTIPEVFPELSVNAAYVNVTLGDLLSHQSGFLNAISPVATVVNAPTVSAQREAAVAWAVQQPAYGPKGSFYYSNAGYVIATAMLERVFGTTYEAAMATHLFAPLGVTDVGWGGQAPGTFSQPIAHVMQNGSWTVVENMNNPPPWAFGAGGAYMSLASWGRLMREMLRVEANASTVANPAAARQTTSPMISVASGSYGMGWYLGNLPWANGRVVYHDGTNTGNHSLVYIAPLRNVAFLATTNGFVVTGHSLGALDALISRVEVFYSTGQ